MPTDNPMSAAKVMLGRRLFYDADLSIDGTIARATCHEQNPGLANVAWLTRLTAADPRLATLEAQVDVPLFGERPVEMGMRGMGTGIARALAAFQRSFIARASAYDRFRAGAAGASDGEAKAASRCSAVIARPAMPGPT